MKSKLFLTFTFSILIFTFSIPTPTHADITTGLVGHWKFDENSGSTAGDSSGNNNTGTLTNGPSWTTGKINGGLQFDGVDDFVDIGSNSSLNNTPTITLSGWVKPSVLKTEYLVYWWSSTFYRKNYYLQITSNGSLIGGIGFPNGSSPNSISCTFGGAGTVTVDNWQHFSMTWNGSTLTGYKNGLALDVTCGGSGSITNLSNSSASIGTSLQGSLDDIRIYNRALSSSEITELYNYTGEQVTPPPTPTSPTPVPPSVTSTPPITQATTDTYWVSPTGTASWTNCRSDTPLHSTSACSLSTTNANIKAGDTAYLRGGTYNTHIFPANSGTSLSNKIIYSAYGGEIPVISNTVTTYATYYHGIALIGRNYIKVQGVKVDNPHGVVPAGKDRILMITHGGSYNEISNCTLDGNGGGVISIWDGGSTPHPSGSPAKHNWIHDCVIKNTGSVDWSEVSGYVNDNGGMQIGVPSYDNESGNNTIENNTFFCGGHHNLETFTKYNVIKNNYFHHEGCMVNQTGYNTLYGPDSNGLYGNRNIQIYDGYNEDKFNLIEGNKFGHAGPPPDDDGGDGMTITAPKNIIRYNSIFNSLNNGVLFKTGANSLADNNRFYNNTIYKSGRYRNTGAQWQGYNFRWYGSYARMGNVIKNNILNSYGTGDWLGGDVNIYTNNKVTNNFCTNPLTGKCSASGDPFFVNTDVSNPLNQNFPNLSLQLTSPAINAGIFLTTTSGSGTNSTTLKVDDALYFQDGSWGSDLARNVTFFPDSVVVGNSNNVSEISNINYTTNTITLKSPISWNDGDPVYLYRNSSKQQVLYGSAPDMGAFEYVTSGGINPPSPPAYVPPTVTPPSSPTLPTITPPISTLPNALGVETTAEDPEITRLRNILATLLKQVADLQAQLLAKQGGNTTKLNLTRTLYIGTKGTDVTNLQTFLITKGYLTQGNATGYFGNLTRQAVQKYQCDKLGICSGSPTTNGYGVVGPKTRGEIGK